MAMTRVEASVEVNAPVKEVFAYASDWPRFGGEWWQGVSDFRPTTEVTRGTGTRYAYKAWMAGIAMNLETEIHDLVENVGWKGEATKGPPFQARWVFEDRGGTTRLSCTVEYSLPLPLLGPLLDSLLMRPRWQRMLERSLLNLKAHFEGQGGSPPTGGAPTEA